MASPQPETFLLTVTNLDRTSDTPLYRQLYDGLRQAILDRRLESGLKLPSTRDLAAGLDLSRNTVKNAYEQLVAEGYLEAETGAGTFVTRQLPADLPSPLAAPDKMRLTGERPISPLGQGVSHIGCQVRKGTYDQPGISIFDLSGPDLEAFPLKIWRKITAEVQKSLPLDTLTCAQDGAGYLPLRQAVAAHLRAARAVACEPEQVVITLGAHQALYLTAQTVISSGQKAWVEEPGYGGAKGSLLCNSIKPVPVPVDEEGLDVAAGMALAPDARLAIVTPSHQFPLGYTMSLSRRFQLMNWASQAGSWIVEDDYDSEFRYSGPPLAALQGLDSNGRVIYIGTFSKVLFPAIRLAYLVLPPDLVDAYVGVKATAGVGPPIVVQAVTAEFIRQGHFARHIRRMRRLYHQRRDVLLEELACQLGDVIEIGSADCGMHLTIWLPEEIDEDKLASRLAPPARFSTLRYTYMNEPPRPGLILSFAAACPAEIQRGVKQLRQAIETATAKVPANITGQAHFGVTPF
ncbi:MAG: PLP-dependent aminotransferase family protein [Candidatus Promineifilaceae bacterium]